MKNSKCKIKKDGCFAGRWDYNAKVLGITKFRGVKDRRIVATFGGPMELITANTISADPATVIDLENVFEDDHGRGEFVILAQAEEIYIQAAGEDDGPYELEYREGDGASHFRCKHELTKAQVKSAFIKYFNGDSSWKTSLEWEPLELKPWWKFW